MPKPPKVILTDNLQQVQAKDALIYISTEPVDLKDWSTPAALTLCLCFDSEEQEEEKGEEYQPVLLEDTEAILDFLEGVRDFETVRIVSSCDPCSSFAVAWGCGIYYGGTPTAVLHDLVKKHPQVAPNAPWLVSLLDYSLKQQMKMVVTYDEYYAAQVVVTLKGNVAEGIWSKASITHPN